MDMDSYTKHEDIMFHRLLKENQLSRSIKARAHPFVMERVFEVVLKRVHDPIRNPPLRIAVFGGSVVEGHRCRYNKIGMDTSIEYNQVLCAWPTKLEALLNEILPVILLGEENTIASSKTVDRPPVVEVKNLGWAGTDSSIGIPIVQYDLFGTNLSETDIFISAYGPNDMLSPVGQQRDSMFWYMQQFHKVAKARRPCNDLPLLIQIADISEETMRWPGPADIVSRLRYSNEVLDTVNWQTGTSGILALSYPDVVREVLFHDIHDDTLTESTQVHPGLAFHSGVAWMIAYGLVDGILQSCDASSLDDHDKPEPRAGMLFPSLHHNLPAEDVPKQWINDTIVNKRRCELSQRNDAKCAFQIMLHRNGAEDGPQSQRAVESIATHIDGWKAPTDKPGWTAIRRDATFTIQLENLTQPVNRFIVVVSGRTYTFSSQTSLRGYELILACTLPPDLTDRQSTPRT